MDLDDVVWDFVGNLLQRYNLKYRDNLTKDDIKDWDISKFISPECKNIFKEFVNEDFFCDLRVHSKIKTSLELINEYADLYFVTAGHSKSIYERSVALKRDLKWFKDSQLVKLSDKSRFLCDYLVDNNWDNCLNSNGKAYLIDQPWNQQKDLSGTNIKRTTVLEALDEILFDIFQNQKSRRGRKNK